MTRELIKKSLLALLHATGGIAWMRHKTCTQMRILSYHGVVSDKQAQEKWNADGFFISESLFRAQLSFLGQNYVPTSLYSAVKTQKWPNHAVALTFDDGFLNNFSLAVPILQEFGFPATFFIATGFIDGQTAPWWMKFRQHAQNNWTESGDCFRLRLAHEEKLLRNLSDQKRTEKLRAMLVETGFPSWAAMMSWKNLNELVKNGFDIGAHTVNHLSLGHDQAAIDQEISESTQQLRTKLACPIRGFSYPYGAASNLGVCDGIFAKLHIDYAVTDMHGTLRHTTPRYFIPRLAITNRHTPQNFSTLLSGWR